MKRLSSLFLAFVLAGQLLVSGCPVPKIIKGGDAVDQALAGILLTVSNTRRFLELNEQLYCPGCATHLIDQQTALRLNAAGAQIIDYAGKAFSAIKAKTTGSRTTLTPTLRADLESYGLAMLANVPDSNQAGITSPAAARLEVLLSPLRETISKLAGNLAKLKAKAGDATFMVELSAGQLRTFDELEAVIR